MKMQAEFSHEITLDLPVGDAFPLFTPKGEELWVPGWQPEYLSPETGETAEEMLFRTGSGDETMIWTCLKWEPDRWHARYLRVTPASRVAIVDVLCRADGPVRTVVRVSYAFVALSEAGARLVAATTPDGFAASIDEWARLIHALPAESGIRVSA
jgi:hypothetical protein